MKEIYKRLDELEEYVSDVIYDLRSEITEKELYIEKLEEKINDLEMDE